MKTSLLLLLLFLIVFIGSAVAETVVTEEILYYDVSGSTLADVNKRMFVASPINIGGVKYAGDCRHHIQLQFSLGSANDWCTISSLDVTVRIVYTMPRWIDYFGTPSELQQKWNDYYGRLMEHEEVHGAMARETGSAIEREVAGLRRRSCQELKEAASQAGDAHLKSLEIAYEEYDARTGHGMLEGAELKF